MLENINEITVIGAGTMGREIAQVALMAGYEKVTLNDIKENVLKNASEYIKSGINKFASKSQLIKEDASVLYNRMNLEVDLKKAVEKTDFIIEAIPEILKLKQELFQKIDNYAPKHCVFASNTSSLKLTEIGKTCERQDKVIGMHFFIPIPVLRLIEIIRGKHTSDETVEKAIKLGKSLPALQGKRITPVIQKETPGFIVNRLNCASCIYLNWLLDYAEENNIPD